MPPLSVLIKPASSGCNLRCKYCFYYSLADNREIKSFGLMGQETLEMVVAKALSFADQSCTIAFQGGEPTLTGLGFYRALSVLEKKHNTKKLRIQRAIQTNGLIVDEEWARFFADEEYLVGLSLDGPRDVHDLNRLDAGNNGSFARVMKAVDLFNKHRVAYNILFVVNAVVARHADKVYSFFKKNGFRYLQFIPCLDPLQESPGLHEYSLRPDRYTVFLKTIFDRWYEDFTHDDLVSIRYFDNLVGLILGYPPEACGMSGECTCQFVVEADGGVYPCDFYVNDEWLLGNIKESGFADLRQSDRARAFVEASRHVDPSCAACRWFNLCRGGCRRTREPFTDGKPALNYFCPSYLEFFDYAGDRLVEVARIVAGR